MAHLPESPFLAGAPMPGIWTARGFVSLLTFNLVPRGLFGFQAFDLGFQRIIFLHFSMQKTASQACFLMNADRCQNIGVAHLFIGCAEVFDFDRTFFDQCFDAEIYATQTKPKFLCQVALGQVRVLFDCAHDPKSHCSPIAKTCIVRVTHGYRIRGHARDLLTRRKCLIAFMVERSQKKYLFSSGKVIDGRFHHACGANRTMLGVWRGVIAIDPTFDWEQGVSHLRPNTSVNPAIAMIAIELGSPCFA